MFQNFLFKENEHKPGSGGGQLEADERHSKAARGGKLTDDNLDVIAGKKDELVGKIQERTDLDRESGGGTSELEFSPCQKRWP